MINTISADMIVPYRVDVCTGVWIGTGGASSGHHQLPATHKGHSSHAALPLHLLPQISVRGAVALKECLNKLTAHGGFLYDKRKEREDYAFQRHFDEKRILGCPGV